MWCFLCGYLSTRYSGHLSIKSDVGMSQATEGVMQRVNDLYCFTPYTCMLNKSIILLVIFCPQAKRDHRRSPKLPPVIDLKTRREDDENVSPAVSVATNNLSSKMVSFSHVLYTPINVSSSNHTEIYTCHEIVFLE